MSYTGVALINYGVKRHKSNDDMPIKSDKELLVWIDLEMTGLDAITDNILEVSCIVTTAELDEVDNISMAISSSLETLNNMNSWCQYHHKKSGLWDLCLDSTYSAAEVEDAVIKFLSKYFTSTKPIMCGNCVSQDRKFLVLQMPKLDLFFSHRVLDISSFRVIDYVWLSHKRDIASNFRQKCTHKSLQDLRDNIEELIAYRELWDLTKC